MLYSRKGGSIFHRNLEKSEQFAYVKQKNLRAYMAKVSLFFTTKKKQIKYLLIFVDTVVRCFNN